MEECSLASDSCVRLYNGKNEHILTLLPCHDESCVDLATPDGQVVYCGVPIGLVNVFVDVMGMESF